MEYDKVGFMTPEEMDELIEQGKKIRAICDDSEVPIDEFRAILDIHTKFCYTSDLKRYFTQNKDVALKVCNAYINAIEHFSLNQGDNINEDSSIEDKLLQNCASNVSDIQRLDASGMYENFFVSVLEASKRLYESEDFLDSMLDKYFMEIVPKMSSYSEEDVENAFEKARERESERQNSLLAQYGVSFS